jgi:hypothetical protein
LYCVALYGQKGHFEGPIPQSPTKLLTIFIASGNSSESEQNMEMRDAENFLCGLFLAQSLFQIVYYPAVQFLINNEL